MDTGKWPSVKKQRLQQNTDALRIAFQLEKEQWHATAGERLLMLQYSGFGCLKSVLNPRSERDRCRSLEEDRTAPFSIYRRTPPITEGKSKDKNSTAGI